MWVKTLLEKKVWPLYIQHPCRNTCYIKPLSVFFIWERERESTQWQKLCTCAHWHERVLPIFLHVKNNVLLVKSILTYWDVSYHCFGLSLISYINYEWWVRSQIPGHVENFHPSSQHETTFMILKTSILISFWSYFFFMLQQVISTHNLVFAPENCWHWFNN